MNIRKIAAGAAITAAGAVTMLGLAGNANAAVDGGANLGGPNLGGLSDGLTNGGGVSALNDHQGDINLKAIAKNLDVPAAGVALPINSPRLP
ncbi:hypothetical protein F0L68_09445 [Solihabitans fulvus]|uniref:Secreted protein n=1 Tax=Solihabitans fulvus TaxID=1892852 RepID=A0A5B2XKR8_9PSEU|nr:hypothetical protein [Solihabitans fulvus]KAA2263704.1 hypothetical protein F0L68_09445 [Solihabitans fulvus]